MSSNIEVKLDVLNQKASPALYAAPLADRPVASFEGRLFVDSDNPSTGVYRDTGSAWIQIADIGAGTSGTLQQVTTNGNTSNVGISVTANGIGIGTTIPTTNRIDIHAASGIQATFNGTGTTNSALQLQSAGVGKWNVTNKYNSAANDFAITDVLNSLDRLTIKNTGQTFIGLTTTSSGAFVVNNATSDNHIVILGANAPSLRFRNAGTGGTLNTGIGISTATNNFIQGSVSGDYCIFNSSTTASPILFGIYDSGTGNTVEAARISAARNLLVGGVTDSGQKLQISGTALITGNLTANFFTASAVNSIFTTVSSGTAAQYAILATNTGGSSYFGRESSTGGTFSSDPYSTIIYSTGNYPIDIFVNSTLSAIWSANGNLTLGNTAGTGLYNLFANSATFRGTVAISNTVTAAVAVASTHKVSILINGVQYYLLATNV